MGNPHPRVYRDVTHDGHIRNTTIYALVRSGSRDTSTQLFTALCRGLDISARLVISLQSVPWYTHVRKPKPVCDRKRQGKKNKGTVDESLEDQSDADESMKGVRGGSMPGVKDKAGQQRHSPPSHAAGRHLTLSVRWTKSTVNSQ